MQRNLEIAKLMKSTKAAREQLADLAPVTKKDMKVFGETVKSDTEATFENTKNQKAEKDYDEIVENELEKIVLLIKQSARAFMKNREKDKFLQSGRVFTITAAATFTTAYMDTPEMAETLEAAPVVEASSKGGKSYDEENVPPPADGEEEKEEGEYQPKIEQVE